MRLPKLSSNYAVIGKWLEKALDLWATHFLGPDPIPLKTKGEFLFLTSQILGRYPERYTIKKRSLCLFKVCPTQWGDMRLAAKET